MKLKKVFEKNIYIYLRKAGNQEEKKVCEKKNLNKSLIVQNMYNRNLCTNIKFYQNRTTIKY